MMIVPDRGVQPSFLDVFDALLLDMDGTLIHGSRAIDHAVEAVEVARARGLALSFATNNASRTPQMVVDHLGSLGFEAKPDEVVNSPMVATALLATLIEPGSHVLVVGGEGILAELSAQGFIPVREDTPEVAAVLHGFAPTVGWRDLAEAAYAIGHGAIYVATNVDSTLPTERGFAPGNGSLVAALTHATGVTPRSAGKPEPDMFLVAAERAGATRPLAVGDRLDTDLEGGNRAGIPTFHTLTGVSSWRDAVAAPPIQRPTFIRPDLSHLQGPATSPVIEGSWARFGDVSATFTKERIEVSGATSSWRVPQLVISLVSALSPEEAFTGDVVSAEGSELTPPLFR
ncbi:MAG: HAD-IIA family hydrolase [Dermabacter sp.]|nr:HAD-IIA family hydrolase [Dermabacter sp.]